MKSITDYLVAEDKMRLDRYVRSILPGVPQALVEKLLRKGEIRLNNSKALASSRVQRGDTVSIRNVDRITSRSKEAKEVHDDALLRLVSDNIIYKDENIIAINKPAGVNVQGGTKVSISLSDLLNKIIPGEQLHIVHRLDRDTSGVLIIARGQSIARILSEELRFRRVRKEYIAVTKGVPAFSKGEITMPIYCKKQSGVGETLIPKEAKTVFSVLQSSKRHAVMLLSPVTGRKHQLRIHLSQFCCPIIGDTKYSKDTEVQQHNSLHLHAFRTSFQLFDREIVIKAPVPEYMIATINELFGDATDVLSFTCD
ncbi:Ribosomal large subunit pseudouridine synthase C [Anaplasma phagocytophilum]|nr:Ribosomal large subunit pseudouridine synthase C [Anaplasma phagocytophilum]